MSILEKIKNGYYENKLPYSPATVNLNTYLKYEQEEERLHKLFKQDLENELHIKTNIEIKTNDYLEIYNDVLNAIKSIKAC